MMVPQHDGFYCFKSLILPPLYLSNLGILDDAKEMIVKEPIFCQRPMMIDPDETDNTSASDSLTIRSRRVALPK